MHRTQWSTFCSAYTARPFGCFKRAKGKTADSIVCLLILYYFNLILSILSEQLMLCANALRPNTSVIQKKWVIQKSENWSNLLKYGHDIIKFVAPDTINDCSNKEHFVLRDEPYFSGKFRKPMYIQSKMPHRHQNSYIIGETVYFIRNAWVIEELLHCKTQLALCSIRLKMHVNMTWISGWLY